MRPLLLILLLTTAPGCIAVDYLVDPVGCGTGSHTPVFPWYPSFLWDKKFQEECRRSRERERIEGSSGSAAPQAPQVSIAPPE